MFVYWTNTLLNPAMSGGCCVNLNTGRNLIQPLGEPALFPALHLYGVRSAYRRQRVLSVVPSVDRNVDLGAHRDGGPGDLIGPPSTSPEGANWPGGSRGTADYTPFNWLWNCALADAGCSEREAAWAATHYPLPSSLNLAPYCWPYCELSDFLFKCLALITGHDSAQVLEAFADYIDRPTGHHFSPSWALCADSPLYREIDWRLARLARYWLRLLHAPLTQRAAP
jgi:hypothetical protein